MIKVIMLAAGEGTRCYPFTYLSPKITQEICGIPLLEFMLSWFSGTEKIEKLFIVLRHDETTQVIQKYINKRKLYIDKFKQLFHRLGYNVNYVNTDFEVDLIRANGWETGGDLRKALREITYNEELNEDFMVCNGDYVIIRHLKNGELSIQIDLEDIMNYHKKCKRALGTVMTDTLFPVKRNDSGRFGVADTKEVNGFKIITDFIEKPDVNEISKENKDVLVNAGIYIIDKNFIFKNIDKFLPDKPGTRLEKTLLEPLAKASQDLKKPKLAGYSADLFGWFDVGTLDQLIDVNIRIASRKGGYIPPPNKKNNVN